MDYEKLPVKATVESKPSLGELDKTQLQNKTTFKEPQNIQLNTDKIETTKRLENLNGNTNKDESKMDDQEQESLINEIRQQIDHTELKNKDLQLEYEKLADVCVRLKRENETLKLELDAASCFPKAEEIFKLKQQNEKLVLSLAELQQQFECIQTEYDDLSNQLMDSLQEEEASRDNYEKLEIKYNALIKSNSVPISDTEHSQNSKNNITENHAFYNGKNKADELPESNEQLKEQVEILLANNEQLCAENKSLLESTEQTISEMRIEITKLSAELIDKSTFVESSDAEQSKETVKLLTNTIESLELEKNQLKQQIDTIFNELQLLQKQLVTIKTLAGEKENLENSIGSLKTEYDKTLQVFKQDKDILSLAIDQQREEISAFRDREDAFIRTIESLKQELHETKARVLVVEPLLHEHDELENSLATASQENDNFCRQIKTLEEALVEARKETDSHQAQIHKLQQKLKEQSVDAEQKQAELQHLNKLQESQEKLHQEREIIETLIKEKQDLENSLKSLKTEYEGAMQLLKQDKENLSLALEQQKLETTAFKDREETLCLKIKTLTQDLHDAKAKTLTLEELHSKHEQLQNFCAMTKQENTDLSRQIQTLEVALAEAQKNMETNTDTLKTQINKLEADSTAAEQERETLLLEQQRLKTQIIDEHFAQQKQQHEFESLKAELELKCKSLQQANMRLQGTNSSLGQQLQSVTRQVSECQTLRQELERLTVEHVDLQRRLKESITEADRSRKSLEDDVAHHKELLELRIKTCNGQRTLLDTKETAFKADKHKLENTVSCLLLEKKTLEERLYLSESIIKQLKTDVSSLQMNAESTHTFIDHHIEIEKIKHTMPLKVSSPFLERKNRRLRTHDEHRSQSIQAISNYTEP